MGRSGGQVLADFVAQAGQAAEFGQGGLLDLANAFAADAHELGDFGQRALVAAFEAEAKLDDLTFAGLQREQRLTQAV
jgi:hypothetical protein